MVKNIIGTIFLGCALVTGTREYVPGVNTPTGVSISVELHQEYGAESIISKNNESDALFDDDIRLAPASYLYNCHSYAWYCQFVNLNNVWMPDPSGYYESNDDDEIPSYIEITNVSLVLPRDRICYFDSSDQNIHSGIIVSTSGMTTSNNVCGTSNMFIVQSKWGDFGLYEHRGDKCPYTSACSTCSNPATYVKYYRLSFGNHQQHSYTYQTYSSTKHIQTCNCPTGAADYSPCGSLYLNHNFVLYNDFGLDNNLPNYIPRYICSDCGYIKNGPLSN